MAVARLTFPTTTFRTRRLLPPRLTFFITFELTDSPYCRIPRSNSSSSPTFSPVSISLFMLGALLASLSFWLALPVCLPLLTLKLRVKYPLLSRRLSLATDGFFYYRPSIMTPWRIGSPLSVSMRVYELGMPLLSSRGGSFSDFSDLCCLRVVPLFNCRVWFLFLSLF